MAIRGKNGHFLIGTFDDGIIEVDSNGKLYSIYNKHSGLKSNLINTLFLDSFGNLWAGHNQGISKIEYDAPFTRIGENMGVLSFGNVAIKFEGLFFLGSNNGLYKFNPEKRYYDYIPESAGPVLSVKKYRNNLFVGHNKGLFLFEKNKLTEISPFKGVWKILEIPNHDDKLLLCGYRGLQILQMEGNKKFSFTDITGIDQASRKTEFDKEGYLWIPQSGKGITRLLIDLKNGKIKEQETYKNTNIFQANGVYTINGELLFTGETGVFRFNENTKEFEGSNIFEKVLSPDIGISELEEDHLGNIFYFGQTESGILLKKENNAYQKIEKPFLQVHELVDDGIVDFNHVDEDNLIIGASEGFLHFNPNQFSYEADSFQLYIRQLELLGEQDSTIFKIDFGQPKIEEIVIPYQSNSLRFSCSSIYFSNKERTEYSYFIDNFDKNWSHWTTRSEKEYINLPPGDFQFNVKSRNIFQQESEIISIDFSISPPWYRTYWAYLLYLVTVSVLLYFWFNHLKQKHLQEKRILNLEKQKEIDEKESKLAEIEKNKQKEITELKNENLNAAINHKNKELATSTLHLINKNQLLSDIKKGLVKAKETKESQPLKMMLSKLINQIDINIENDSDWDRFQSYFDRVHGGFFKRLSNQFENLSPQDVKIASYLRMNLSSKEIAQLLNISLRGVEKARYRLRKKMNLEKGENLTQLILNI